MVKTDKQVSRGRIVHQREQALEQGGSTTRDRILHGAMEILRDPALPTLTLESAAKMAALTKPGLMYHFPTKESLLLAVVEKAAGVWERLFHEALVTELKESSPEERMRAYALVSLHKVADRADLAVIYNALYFDAFKTVWAERSEAWITIPEAVSPIRRARLLAVRFAADGFWMAAAGGVLPPSPADRDLLMALVEEMLKPV